MQKLIVIFSFILSVTGSVLSQEKQSFLTLNGYLSTMQSVMFDSLSGQFANENLLHNRLNIKGNLSSHLTFAAEFRNRLFTGDLVKSGPSYAESIGSDEGLIDLSWNILNEQSFFLNTTIDRLWVDLNYGKFQTRVGRQRINWGRHLCGIQMIFLMFILISILITLNVREVMQSDFNIILIIHLHLKLQ